MNPLNYSLTVIMPVYNEVLRIKQAIDEVVSHMHNSSIELIIIESASTDGTKEIVQSYSTLPNVKIIFQEEPKGKGSAVRAGLNLASKEITCIFDADLEYQFKDIFTLIEPIISGEAQFVLGSRWVEKNYIRNFQNQKWKGKLLNLIHIFGAYIINKCFAVETKDPFTMWKVFKTELVKSIVFKGNRFEWDLEIIGELAIRGIKPIELPAFYKSRDYSEGKKIKFLKDVPILLKTILQILVKRIFGRRLGIHG